MLEGRSRNLHWSDLNMAELELDKLILHFEQSNRAEGKSPKTITWYTEMITGFPKSLLLYSYTDYPIWVLIRHSIAVSMRLMQISRA